VRLAGTQLDNQLSELNSRLNVGLSFADYSLSVGDLRVAYARMFKQVGRRLLNKAPCLARVLGQLGHNSGIRDAES